MGPAWVSFGGNVQHTALSVVATQPFTKIQWQTPVDLDAEYRNGDLLSHYGSPVISERNTVVVPLKTGRTGGFKVQGRSGTAGALLWSLDSDYVLPEHNWTPSFNATLTTANAVVVPGAGGKLLLREDADKATATTRTLVFYGEALYNANRAALDASVFVNTPVTADQAGNLYFGFVVSQANPVGLTSGIARIAADGTGSWVAAKAVSGDLNIDKVAMNCAPALSADQSTVYLAVNTATSVPPGGGARRWGYLLALQSTTLALKNKVRLLDPATGAEAFVTDDSSASPTIGPDGHVFYGVLESRVPDHNDRGWLLQFDAALNPAGYPGGFGWDDTASVVPASMVPSYTGNSSYLLMTKYNNYSGVGTGDGKNQLAVLDPAASQNDAIAGIPAMREVLTILGATPDLDYSSNVDYAGAVREWCINTAAVDPFTKSIVVNNEDGYLYRWDMTTNTFTERIQLTSGLGEAYTPTAIGPTGAVFAINNAVLFSVGR